jgi:hypothetical protein
MSISSITNGTTGVNFDLFCDVMTCNSMNAGSISPTSITTPTINVDNLTINTSTTSTGTINETYVLSDGSTAKIEMGNNLGGTGVLGVGYERTNLTGIRSSVAVANATSVAGPESVISSVMQDTLNPPKQLLEISSYNGVDFSKFISVSSLTNTSGISIDPTVVNIDGSTKVDLGNTPLLNGSNVAVNLVRTLTDTSINKIEMNNSVNGNLTPGIALDRNIGTINSSLTIADQTVVGGGDNTAILQVNDTSTPGQNISAMAAFHSGSGYHVNLLCADTIDASNFAMTPLSTGLSSAQIRIDGQITATSLLSLGQSMVLADNAGLLSAARFDQGIYSPTVTNVNRVTPVTSFTSDFYSFQSRCYVFAHILLSVGAGIGSPSFLLSLPEVHTAFTTDVIIGSGTAYDPGLTSALPIVIETQTPAGSDAIITIPGGVAGNYHVKLSLSYPNL